jgi:hypothetical protein
MDIFLGMLDDLLKGSAVFRENPEAQLKRLKERYPVRYQPVTDERELERLEQCMAAERELERQGKFKGGVGLVRRVLYYASGHGRLYPVALMRRNEKRDIAPEWQPKPEQFMLVAQVRVYNVYTKQYELRRHDKKALGRRGRAFGRKLRALQARYGELRQDFQSAREALSGAPFWRAYLEIE